MFDSKCYDLAEHFLQDHPGASDAMKSELAQAIQDVVEYYFIGIEGEGAIDHTTGQPA